MRLKGYRRADGHWGIRNHLLIIPTSVCASETASRIASLIPGAVAIPHQHGCCQVGEDYKQTVRTLVGFGRNPNVGAVLVVGLGCEGIQPQVVAEEIAKSGKPVETITIQQCGGTLKTISAGAEICAGFARILAAQEREEFDISELVLGLECGGSDPTSGIASNPSVGRASNQLIDAGGTSILSETTELIGAEHLVAARCVTQELADRLVWMVKRIEEKSISYGVDLRGTQPTPGNIEGGLTTIEEKSLGCIYKAGDKPVVGVLEYAEPVDSAVKGLYFMDTPGEDIDSITGMVAGGAQIVVFTTGRGTPTGCPIAPVIKVTGNPETYERMIDNIDINAGRVILEEASLEEVGQEIFDMMIRVSNGDLTKAESLGHKEFGIYRIGDTF
ncbi:MAG: UxaA family hydrolase [Oscillospiraceae bacterium]|nr:UxaA family hydrolase [Oscillospiraceae bacterium]